MWITYIHYTFILFFTVSNFVIIAAIFAMADFIDSTLSNMPYSITSILNAAGIFCCMDLISLSALALLLPNILRILVIFCLNDATAILLITSFILFLQFTSFSNKLSIRSFCSVVKFVAIWTGCLVLVLVLDVADLFLVDVFPPPFCVSSPFDISSFINYIYSHKCLQ